MEPLTEREVLIAVTAFKAAMNACLAMYEAGFDPSRFCRLALDDPDIEKRVTEPLVRDLERIDKEVKRRADS